MELSTNWKELQAKTSITAKKTQSHNHPNPGGKRSSKRKAMPALTSPPNKKLKPTKDEMNVHVGAERVNEGLSGSTEVGKYIAIDCEMVGVGPQPGRESALARVSIVNYHGEQVYDSFVRPKEMVTDWRSAVSGITPKCMQEARSLEQAQADVARVLDGNILIGHAIRNDLDALLLGHPKRDIRDTARHPPYRQLAGGGSPRLKILASELLGLEIQGQAHSSVEDARATMLLFRRDKEAFEREHAKRWPTRNDSSQADPSQRKTKKKKKKKH